jgi:hypothetical protein
LRIKPAKEKASCSTFRVSVVSFGKTALESCNGDFQDEIRRAAYG